MGSVLEGQIDLLIKSLVSGELLHPDGIVFGDNGSGKSFLLRKFAESVRNGVYFIDVVNRRFDINKVDRHEEKPVYSETVLKTRLSNEYFNVQDSFNCYGNGTGCIEVLFGSYESKLQQLFWELTGGKIGRDPLSPEHQALVRILLELLYYQDTAVSGGAGKHWIVVDGVDVFLSPRYSTVLLEFLKQKFPWANWLVSVYSWEAIASTLDYNLIMLVKDSHFEILDSNDYNSVEELQVFYRQQETYSSNLNDILHNLFNKKVCGVWSEVEDSELEELRDEKLTPSQRLILDQILKL